MEIDAHGTKPWVGGDARVERRGLVHRQPELVVLQARGNIGVGFRIHVRVYPQGHGRLHPRRLRQRRQAPELRLRFHVETANVRVEGRLKLRGAFPYPGKDNLRRIAASGQHPGELASGHDVKARA